MINTNRNIITNANGKFYAGMTADEAKQNKTYKKTFQRDFQDIDTNKDGILSVEEILAERKRSAKKNKGWAIGFALMGVIDGICDKRSKGWLITDLVIDALCVVLELREAKRTEEGTKRIEEMLKSNENPESFNIRA